jgi:hypothetical protein
VHYPVEILENAGPGLDDRNPAGQLGQALLQLLTAVVGVALVDLGTDLVDPTLDLVLVAMIRSWRPGRVPSRPGLLPATSGSTGCRDDAG